MLQVSSVTAGSTLPEILANALDNSTGRINYAAGAPLGSYVNGQCPTCPSGTFTLATVRFTAVGSTENTPLTFNGTNPRKTDATFAGSSVLDHSDDGVVTVAPLPPAGTVVITQVPLTQNVNVGQAFDVIVQVKRGLSKLIVQRVTSTSISIC